MAYGYAKPSSDYRSQGILSLLENMASPKGGAISDREMSYFMDKDTGTEHHMPKQRVPNRVGAMSDKEFDAYGQPITPVNVKELQKKFSAILSSVAPQDQVPVVRDFARSSDDGKINLMQMIVENPDLIYSYGIQDEVPVNNLGF